MKLRDQLASEEGLTMVENDMDLFWASQRLQLSPPQTGLSASWVDISI
jgi:hypothetical protein